jgi:hypothetical protein
LFFRSKLLKQAYGLDISGDVVDAAQKSFRDLPQDTTNYMQEAMAEDHEIHDKAKKDSGEPQRKMKSRSF